MATFKKNLIVSDPKIFGGKPSFLSPFSKKFASGSPPLFYPKNQNSYHLLNLTKGETA